MQDNFVYFENKVTELQRLVPAYLRLLSIKRSIVDMSTKPENMSAIKVICESYSVASNRNIIAIYEDFSQQLKMIKDKIVNLVKQFVAKMKDMTFNLCSKVNIDKVIQTINTNASKVTAAETASQNNSDKTGNLTNVFKQYENGNTSFNIVSGQATILVDWLKDLVEQTNKIKSEVDARKASVEAAKNSTTAASPGTNPTTPPSNGTTGEAPAAAATTETSSFESNCNQVGAGGEWSVQGLKATHGVYAGMITDLNGLVNYSNALENAAKDVSNIVNSLSTDDKDKGQMKQATDLVKFIKDKLAIGNKCVSKINTNVTTIGAVADAVVNALK